MISGFGGRVFLTWTSLYSGVLWALAGFACGLLGGRRGLALAIAVSVIVAVVPVVVAVNPPGPGDAIQFFSFGTDVSAYVNAVAIPLASALFGGLAGALLAAKD